MAKRNSTKTATKEALAASEPRVVGIRQWKGIHLKEAPLDWLPADAESNQQDLPDNYLVIQNNVDTTDTGALLTRMDEIVEEILPGRSSQDLSEEEIDSIFDFLHSVWQKVDPLVNTFYHIASETYGLSSEAAIRWLQIVDETGRSSITAEDLAAIPDEFINLITAGGRQYTGVCCLKGPYIVAAFDDGAVRWKDITQQANIWYTSYPVNNTYTWTDLKFVGVDAGSKLMGFATYEETVGGLSVTRTKAFVAKTSDLGEATELIPAHEIARPNTAPVITDHGVQADPENEDETNTSVMVVTYVYTNEWGQTVPTSSAATFSFMRALSQWDSSHYIEISGVAPQPEWGYIKGVDVYYTLNNATYTNYIGHANVNQTDGTWSMSYYGNLMNTDDWGTGSLALPQFNTTGGPDARFVRQHDGRLYFYGGLEHPERLWIGGNSPNEACVAYGLGGGYIDFDPGTGVEVTRTEKFKTASGASIVTALTRNRNTSEDKRFNVIETNITISNELMEQSYMGEEVANVYGCASFWGSGAWNDGLYHLNRYGLMITSQQMEYVNQLRSATVSDAIQPVFTDRLAVDIENARIICLDNVIYMILATPNQSNNYMEPQEYEDTSGAEILFPDGVEPDLDVIVFCYDTNLKAWWTYTLADVSRRPLNIIPIDYKGAQEGIGLVFSDRIMLIPTTGEYDPSDIILESNGEKYVDDTKYPIRIETPELSLSSPPVGTSHVCQIELDFDWFIGDMEVRIEGIDYYGRHIVVTKHVTETEMQRDYLVWIRVDQKMRTFNMTLKGVCRFRLYDILQKVYMQSKKVNLVYGFDDRIAYHGNHGDTIYEVHHYLDNYNDLRRAIIP